MPENSGDDLFNLDMSFDGPIRSKMFSVAKKPLGSLLCLDKYNKVYARIMDPDLSGGRKPDFIQRALEELGVGCILTDEDLKKIPAEGPLMVVANHPFGIIEGLLLIRAIRSVRPDVRIMANGLLNIIPEMREYVIPVDPFGNRDSWTKNLSGLKEAIRHIKGGGVMGVFPAGEVASLRLRKRMVADPEWSPTVAGIIRKTKASVLPLYFRGRNSALFHFMGMIHPRLRTALLPRENLRQGSRDVSMFVGNPIPFKKLARFKSNEEIIDYLRFRTYVLKNRESGSEIKAVHVKDQHKPIAEQKPVESFIKEIESLPEENFLVESAPFIVFEAGADQIPNILHEIGRLREETFRPVGEGTGDPLDLDRFDQTYRHLVLWNKETQELAGAYRFGQTDKIIAREGVKGLYTSTLFSIKRKLLRNISPAMEMGRSFVRVEYQKSYQPLSLLWRGIGEYVTRNPCYRNLFGCVSVSSDYTALSRELIIEFLERHSFLPELSALVKPKKPPKKKQVKRIDLKVPKSAFDDPTDISSMVGDLESDKSIPVLLKQYLKLGGKVMAFNVDPNFGNCMDGLLLVDLANTEPKILGRFMGGLDKALAFHAHHKALASGGSNFGNGF